MKWTEFSEIIGLDQCTINVGCDSSEEGLLDKDVCAVIVAEWTKLEDNSPDGFLEQIKVIERRVFAGKNMKAQANPLYRLHSLSI